MKTGFFRSLRHELRSGQTSRSWSVSAASFFGRDCQARRGIEKVRAIDKRLPVLTFGFPMTDFRKRLSSAGFANVHFNESDNDFDFIFEHSRFSCSHFLACFLSPRIAQLHLVDSTMNSHSITTVGDANLFQSFLALGFGSELTVTPSNRSFFSLLARELGNYELFRLIEDHFVGDGEALTAENAVSRYCAKKSFGGDFHNEVSFISSHFSEIPSSLLRDLEFADLDLVLSHESLCVPNEDDLFDFVLESGHFSLFEHVHFEFLSAGRVHQFADRFGELNHCGNSAILSRLFGRLVLPVEASSLPQNSARHTRKQSVTCPGRQFVPLDYDLLDGIIAHLTREYGGNVHDCNVVTVSSSRPYGGDAGYAAKNAADLKGDSVFFSSCRNGDDDIPNTRNNWISYDFKDRRVVPTHYSIRSQCKGFAYNINPKSWILEASMDGKEWVEIDRRENNAELIERDVTRMFKVAKSEKCRFIRLVNIGRNHHGSDCLVISSLEIFGSLME
jgi:hypothetical protein